MFPLLLFIGCGGDPTRSSKPVSSDSATSVASNDSGQPDESTPSTDCPDQDLDGDGILDCRDDQCNVSVDGPADVLEGHTCAEPEPPGGDPWRAELLWAYTGVEHGCLVSAAGDLDGDGVVEVLCTAIEPDLLVVLDGRDGSVRWTSTVFDDLSKLAIGDIDADGAVDLVGYSRDHRVHALEGYGSPKWVSQDEVGDLMNYGTRSAMLPIEIADLDADGAPEVITPHAVIRGQNGTTRWWLDTSLQPESDSFCSELAIGDIDRDGVQEVISNWTVWSGDTPLWSIPPSPRGLGGTPMLVQADHDAAAEVFWYAFDTVRLVDTDGTLLWELPTPFEPDPEPPNGAWLSTPCAGDLDGDGLSEIVMNDQNWLYAWSSAGALLWQAPFDDDIGFVACAVFDLDHDGFPEVVTSDEFELSIHDGRTGEARLTWDRPNWTAGEPHLILDVDGDGSVEIVVSQTGANWEVSGHAPPVMVLTHPDGGWAPGSARWGSSTWTGTNTGPNGAVPRLPARSWPGGWRTQAAYLPEGADLRPEVMDSCISACQAPGVARVAFRLVNLGPAEVPAGVPLAVYQLDAAGSRALLSVSSSGEPLGPGMGERRFSEVVLPVADAEHGLLFVAGDDGAGGIGPEDCGADNNEVLWTPEVCLDAP